MRRIWDPGTISAKDERSIRMRGTTLGAVHSVHCKLLEKEEEEVAPRADRAKYWG